MQGFFVDFAVLVKGSYLLEQQHRRADEKPRDPQRCIAGCTTTICTIWRAQNRWTWSISLRNFQVTSVSFNITAGKAIGILAGLP